MLSHKQATTCIYSHTFIMRRKIIYIGNSSKILLKKYARMTNDNIWWSPSALLKEVRQGQNRQLINLIEHPPVNVQEGGLDGAFCKEMASTNGLYTKKIVNWIWIWGFNTRPIKKWTGNIKSMLLESWTSCKMDQNGIPKKLKNRNGYKMVSHACGKN